MARRAADREATRRRIIDAAIDLHARRGSRATSWDDIAEVAQVSRATVYHYFGSLRTLIPACAQVAFELAEVPTLEEAANGFADLSDPRRRVSRLVFETCKCYAAGADWLRAAWRERDLVPEMAEAVTRLQKARDILIAAAVAGSGVSRDARRALGALLDFSFWDSLEREGIPRGRIAHHIDALASKLITAKEQL